MSETCDPRVLFEHLSKLISFPTISSESNLELIDYVEELLQEHGFRTRRFFNRDGNKANLVASIGPEDPGGVLLSGHTDVVPVKGQKWNTDPFNLSPIGENWFGRGTSDMKGFLAVVLCEIKALDLTKLHSPLHLVLTYDEEVGCLGALELTTALREDSLLDSLANCRFAVIGEPTNGKIVNRHKGIEVFRTSFEGVPAHSSQTSLGLNAIEWCSRFIDKIPELIPMEKDSGFDPPLSTWNLGKIQGGNAINIIAQHCCLDWEVRSLPSQDPAALNEGIEQSLRKLCETDRPGLQTQHRSLVRVPAFHSELEKSELEFLKTTFDSPDAEAVCFATEAGILQDLGIPSFVCGPGSIRQAHQPDEHVSERELTSYAISLHKLIQSTLMG
jgi:acetylornithine deacetylase